jgi:aspartate ammonia-lyase
VSPNDHVNMSQSTNDTYPTAIRIAVLNKYKKLNESLIKLEKQLNLKAKEFNKVIKT